MNEIRTCNTCKYVHTRLMQEPCNTCMPGDTNWESAEGLASQKPADPRVCRSPYCECPADACKQGLPDMRGENLVSSVPEPEVPDQKTADMRKMMDAVCLGVGVTKEHVSANAWFTVDELNKWAEEKAGQGNTPEAMATGGVKYDADKPRMDLLDAYAIEELAKVLAFGAKKYDAHNWRKGITKGRLIAAALRHLFAYLRGEDKDPETGLSHAAHAMCCCMFLLGLGHRADLDDRWSEPK